MVDPEVIVALGATAAKALLGASFRVTKQRGELVEWEDGRTVTAKVHPSSILRARGRDSDESARAEARAGFVADLAAAAAVLSG